MEANVYIGIDVAKEWLDIAARPEGEAWRARNDEAGIQELVGQLVERAPRLIVLEATGGLETALAAGLTARELPVVIVNPRQVRDFARATGQLAKTDAIDARVLAQFGEAVNPEPRPLPEAATQELAALMARRRQVVEMLTAEKNRLRSAARPVRRDIQRHIHWLERGWPVWMATWVRRSVSTPSGRIATACYGAHPGSGRCRRVRCSPTCQNLAGSIGRRSQHWSVSHR